LDPDSDEGNCRFCFLKAKHKIVTIMRNDIQANDGKVTDEIIRWIQREKIAQTTFRVDRKDYAGLLEEALFGAPIEKSPVDEKVIDCICGE
jgi:hypothetical protein